MNLNGYRIPWWEYFMIRYLSNNGYFVGHYVGIPTTNTNRVTAIETDERFYGVGDDRHEGLSK